MTQQPNNAQPASTGLTNQETHFRAMAMRALEELPFYRRIDQQSGRPARSLSRHKQIIIANFGKDALNGKL